MKRKKQIELHRKVPVKKHNYLLRIPQSEFQNLQIMARDKSMSKVLLQGLKTEWNYYLAVQQLMKETPRFKSVEQLEKWKLKYFKNSPELLAKYVMPATLKIYLTQLEKHDKLAQFKLIQWNTIAYFLNRIGVNLNQLAHKANQESQVSREDLQMLTKSVMQLSKLIQVKFNNSKWLEIGR